MPIEQRLIVRSPEDLGRAIGELRRAQGLTQEQMATHAGTSRDWIAQLERGRMSRSFSIMLRLIRRLGGELVVIPAQAADGEA
jgi:transcriptional regulator with XRE-family HTH domain